MGFFDSMKDSLISRALNETIGPNFRILNKFTCILTLPASNYKKLNVVVVQTDTGIYFINRGDVVIGIPWNDVLLCSEGISAFRKKVELDVLMRFESVGTSRYKLEFPYSHWHRLEFEFIKSDSFSPFMETYFEILGLSELTESSRNEWISLMREWLIAIPLPLEEQQFKSQFSQDTPRQSIDDAYFWLGQYQDAQRFLFYVGRKAMINFCPESLFDSATKEWARVGQKLEELTGIPRGINEKLNNLIEKTKQLKTGETTLEKSGFISLAGLVETREGEWQSPIHMNLRRAIIGTPLYASAVMDEFGIWNDFNDGTYAKVRYKDVKYKQGDKIETDVGLIQIL